MNWVGGLLLALLPQVQDLVVDCASGWVTVVAPDCIQKLAARNDPVWIRNEELQQLELKSREIHRLARSFCLMPEKVDLNVTELGGVDGIFDLRAIGIGMMHTAEQIVPRERE